MNIVSTVTVYEDGCRKQNVPLWGVDGRLAIRIPSERPSNNWWKMMAATNEANKDTMRVWVYIDRRIIAY